MGFEDEAEQSLGRRCRYTNGRSKRTYELTSSIVPRRTSFHGLVELEYSPIVIDPAWLLCRRDLPGPTELSAINPYAVHDHGQSARQGHNRLLHSANAVMCQKQTFRHSFDYLVSESEQRRRKFQTDRLCRLEVDYK